MYMVHTLMLMMVCLAGCLVAQAPKFGLFRVREPAVLFREPEQGATSLIRLQTDALVEAGGGAFQGWELVSFRQGNQCQKGWIRRAKLGWPEEKAERDIELFDSKGSSLDTITRTRILAGETFRVVRVRGNFCEFEASSGVGWAPCLPSLNASQVRVPELEVCEAASPPPLTTSEGVNTRHSAPSVSQRTVDLAPTSSRVYHRGDRGGCYYLVGARKVYVDHSYCR